MCPPLKINIDLPEDPTHVRGMASIGDRALLKVLRAAPSGIYLDGEELGEILLPRREVPAATRPGDTLDVFIYHDSEDRVIATLEKPKAIAGEFARLRCVEVNPVGAFLDWGLAKDLLVPFREQKSRMEVGRFYLVYVFVDAMSGRLVATTRLNRHLNLTPPSFSAGQAVDLLIFQKSPLGYQAVINGTHSGLLFGEKVFQPLQPGERIQGFIADVRDDGKIDLTLHPPGGRERVDDLGRRILAELTARGGFWALGDHSPAALIHDELGVSKRTFKQTLGALLKQGSVTAGPDGIRRVL